MIKVGILGATGYVGEELARLLLQHPKAEISSITSQSYIGKEFDSVYENFKNIFTQKCEKEDIESMADNVDMIFLALPHGIASKKINQVLLKKVKIIDIGADFRLKDKNTYESWYEIEHHSGNLLEEAVYGLCEWKRDKVKNANLVANPGCYTTCSILSLAPLLKEGILKEDSIIIDAKSGISGAGRSLNIGTHFTECNESVKAYKIASHRHTPEIEQELSEISGKSVMITFTPHLIPVNRGILTTSYASLKDKMSYKDIQDIYNKYYGKEYFIRLTQKNILPEIKWIKGSNFCDIGFSIDERTNRVIIIGVLDNMIKGAAGQAIQNMNLMFGLEEQMGLMNIPIFPV